MFCHACINKSIWKAICKRFYYRITKVTNNQHDTFINCSLVNKFINECVTHAPMVSADGHSVAFQTPEGGTALKYGGLKAWDATGKSLEVHFTTTGVKSGCLGIEIEDGEATYPIHIDPVERSKEKRHGLRSPRCQISLRPVRPTYGLDLGIR